MRKAHKLISEVFDSLKKISAKEFLAFGCLILQKNYGEATNLSIYQPQILF